MKGLNQFLNTDVEVVISGDTRFVDALIDIGQDILLFLMAAIIFIFPCCIFIK